MGFLHWFNQRINPNKLDSMQSSIADHDPLRNEFSFHPSKGLTPAKLAGILLQAEQGNLIAQANLFMDMEEKDAHLGAEMYKRKMAVKKLDWMLNPPSNATEKEMKNTQILENLIRDELDCGAMIMDMMDAIGHGFSCIELGWARNFQGLWFPNQVAHRPPSWFTCPQDNRNTLHLRDAHSIHGAPLQQFGWIPHLHRARSGYIARSGLFRVLAWPYLYKNFSVRDLAEFLETYGVPIRIGKYRQGASNNEKRDLLRAILSIGHNAAGIIPDSMQIELQHINTNAVDDSFKVMIDWCEESQSRAILGGTLTSSTGANGNHSLGEIHNEVRFDIRDDDAKQIDQTLSSYLVYPMAMLNGLFDNSRCPEWVSDTQEPYDLALYADAMPKLISAGAKISTRYVNMKLKIPYPKDGEPILKLQ